MKTPINLNELNSKIELIKKSVEELNCLGTDFPALNRNTLRILASLKMLELNISDMIVADGDMDFKV